MLQDLVSARLLSDYTVLEIPDSVHDSRGTDKVRGSRQTAQPDPSALSRIQCVLLLALSLMFLKGDLLKAQTSGGKRWPLPMALLPANTSNCNFFRGFIDNGCQVRPFRVVFFRTYEEIMSPEASSGEGRSLC